MEKSEKKRDTIAKVSPPSLSHSTVCLSQYQSSRGAYSYKRWGIWNAHRWREKKRERKQESVHACMHRVEGVSLLSLSLSLCFVRPPLLSGLNLTFTCETYAHTEGEWSYKNHSKGDRQKREREREGDEKGENQSQSEFPHIDFLCNLNAYTKGKRPRKNSVHWKLRNENSEKQRKKTKFPLSLSLFYFVERLYALPSLSLTYTHTHSLSLSERNCRKERRNRNDKIRLCNFFTTLLPLCVLRFLQTNRYVFQYSYTFSFLNA